MILKDVNQTLVPPAGFDLYDVRAEGSYLRLEYNQTKYDANMTAVGWTATILYLNDQGREVLRTEQYIAIAPKLPPGNVSIPKPWYFVWAEAVLRFFHLD
jgi:hypothetical protein